jgi:hypothetical protein
VEDEVCALDLEFVTSVVTRVIKSQYSATSTTIGRNVRAIQGNKRWAVLSSSAGSLVGGQVVNDLPDATDITIELQDGDVSGAPHYRLIFRFDGEDVTIKSFVEL